MNIPPSNIPPAFPQDAAGAAALIAKRFKADPESRIATAVAEERARIRRLALDQAERWLAAGSEFAAQALRELAALLEDR